MKFIVYNPATKLFDFFINSLKYEFKKVNIELIKYDKNIHTNYDFINDVIMIIIDPHFIFDYNEIEVEISKISKNFKFKILYITEPINFMIEKIIYTKLIKNINPYCLWTYTMENFNKINLKTKLFKLFPINKMYQMIDVDLEKLKIRNNNSIIFFGNINENRINTCNKFNNSLINKTDAWSLEEWSEILNNNLFYLNIHRRNNCKSFESFRIIPILANGGVIFSERCNNIEENLYKDYNIIFVEKKDLYDTFIKYISNINYNEIYEKYEKYINDMKPELNEYLEYHNIVIKDK